MLIICTLSMNIVGLANGRQVQKAISDAEGVGDSFLHARMEEER